MVESYSYDVFGQPSNTSDVNNPYLFTGRTAAGQVLPPAGRYFVNICLTSAEYYGKEHKTKLKPGREAR